jgi:hypothetical protein
MNRFRIEVLDNGKFTAVELFPNPTFTRNYGEFNTPEAARAWVLSFKNALVKARRQGE